MAKKKILRIKDIAKAAGVSVGTVDRVLHKRGKVSDKALKKINAILTKNEYKPNLIARTLGSNKSYKIAALLPNPQQDPYWSIAYQGIIQAETEWSHYGLRVVSCVFDLLKKESFKETAERVLKQKPDGILIAPIFYNETLPYFKLFYKKGIPYVLFNTNITESNGLSFIGQDLYQSGRVAAELICLGQQGKATFGVLHVDEDLNDSVHLLEKERGFKDFIKENYKGDSSIESLNRTSSSDFSFKKRLAALLNKTDLKGVFVSSSKGTATAATFLKSHGKDGIRLVGYDLLEKNIEYLKSGAIDFLIHQKPQQQAFEGISSLANHLIFKKDPPSINLFPLEVITRQNMGSYLIERPHSISIPE
ncbi:MAG: substrate-binding domain-containing protein [Bacteroidetes bacterium]|nr:substrate-binding domain-containing protein [Bacteroidota bacterium]